MKDYIAQRVEDIARYMLETKGTVRGAAAKFGVSKSTVHKDISDRLKSINKVLYSEVKDLLDTNKKERHIRGGNATRFKYMKYKK